MRRLAVSAFAMMGVVAASAADYPTHRGYNYFPSAPSVYSPAPVYGWSGFYLGAQAGYASGEDETRLLLLGLPIATSPKYDVEGFVGGIHAGFNVQMGMVVGGIEADVEFADTSGKLVASIPTLPGYSASVSTEFNWQASLRARLGIAADRLLVYATGGLAYANLDDVYSVTLPGFAFLGNAGRVISETGAETNQWGWTLGGGVEYAFTNNLTTRLEYRFTDFQKYEHTSSVLAPGGIAEQKLHFHAVRVGLSYKY